MTSTRLALTAVLVLALFWLTARCFQVFGFVTGTLVLILCALGGCLIALVYRHVR